MARELVARTLRRVKSYSQIVQEVIDKNLSPEAMGAEFLRRAEARVASEIASGRAPAEYVRAVNGRDNAPDRAVTVPGVIVYRFDNLGAVVAFAIDYAINRSPFRTGKFREGFMVALDGVEMPASSFTPDKAAGAREVFLWNRRPQSRKIDVQLIGRRPIRFSVEAGLFTDTAAAVKRRYGNVVNAERIYTLRFPDAYILRQGRDKGTPVQSPVVVITVR